jgi:hypothetical protein
MNALRFSAVPLLALALALGATPFRASDVEGHRPGLRDQWQPQTEHDPRLAQPVRIEILGRAAVPALELLSKATGVSLRVAPENLDTVGERKLTVIAQGCSLKSIMVQVPNALQECHWDVDSAGERPVYLLHRNAGAAQTMTELAEEELRGYRERGRPVREERVASARKALAMSPQELDELAKTDPLLAASVKDPDSRRQMELLLSLPSDAMQEFLANGVVTLSYGSAPENLQQGCREILQRDLDFAAARQEGRDQWTIDTFTYALSHPDSVTFTFKAHDMPGAAWAGAWQGANIYRPDGGGIEFASAGAIALPPRLPLNREWEITRWAELLVKTGIASEGAARERVTELAQTSARTIQEYLEGERATRGAQEPRSPELHRVVMLPFKDSVDPVEVQRFVAQQTGLSLISDYFTGWGLRPIREEAQQARPVWEVLSALGEQWFWTYQWDEVGDCLVFHDRYWYRAAPREFPESLVSAYREKLKRQGRFTLDDIAAAAVGWERRRATRPSLPGDFRNEVAVPPDLAKAGLSGDAVASSLLVLYATLTPAQRERARTPDGLSYSEMTAPQQALLRRSSTEGGDKRQLREDQIAQATYRIEEGRETFGSSPKLSYRILAIFPTSTVRTGAFVDPPAAQ